MIKKSKKCKWCKTPIKVSRKLYCNNSCRIFGKRKRDQKYRNNLNKKMKEKRKIKDKIYAKERWENTKVNPIKLEAKRTYDKKWQSIEYWKNKKIIKI